MGLEEALELELELELEWELNRKWMRVGVT